jgi:NRPS condensation-like uncharacterized protein
MKTRQLSPLELFSFKLNQLSAFNFQIEAEFRHSIPVEILSKALAIVQRRHYYLNVTIQQEADATLFRPSDLEIPLRTISNAQPGDWIHHAEEELNRRFDYQYTPLLRALAVSSTDQFNLILTFDHSIGDGLSGMHLLHDLIGICHTLSKGAEDWDDSEIPPAVVREENFPTDLPKEMRYFSPKRERMENERYAPVAERFTRFLPQHIERGISERFAQRCREKGVTVHAGLSAAILHTLAAELEKQRPSETPIDMDAVSAISLRNHLRDTFRSEQLGLAAVQLKTPHQIGPDTSLWETAADVSHRIKNIIANKEFFLQFRKLGEAVKRPPDDSFKAHERGSPNITLSNLGLLEFPPAYDHFGVVRANFTGTMNLAQSTQWGVLVTAVHCSFSQRLALNFHYLEPYWDRPRAERFAADCMQRLAEA